LKGIFCESNQKCDGEIKNALDGSCCMNECKEVKKSSTWKWVGWGIVFLIVIFIIWFVKFQYRNVKRTIDLVEVAIGKRK
jgi:t-SNARE complex subunit (syntaxin)